VSFKLKIVLTAALALTAMSASAQDYVGVVKRSSGQVLIEREGVKLAPSAGTEVMRGDRVITGSDGYAHITLHGAAPLSISPDADVSLDRFAAGPISTQRTVPGLIQRLASFLAVNRQRP
jgi:hypothetical protein